VAPFSIPFCFRISSSESKWQEMWESSVPSNEFHLSDKIGID